MGEARHVHSRFAQPQAQSRDDEPQADKCNRRPHPGEKSPLVGKVFLCARFLWDFAMFLSLGHRSRFGCRSFLQSAQREINDKCNRESDEPGAIISPDRDASALYPFRESKFVERVPVVLRRLCQEKNSRRGELAALDPY